MRRLPLLAVPLRVSDLLDSPYPYHGGKRRAAHLIWPRLGPDVPNYIEPFFGSGAVWLLRPNGPGKIETINDIDGGIVNFWRSIQHAPEEVERWCDWPVSELDLHARHEWLFQQLPELAEKLRSDPDHYDAKIAGWWVWGICLWIGSGWCRDPRQQRPELRSTGGVHRNDMRTDTEEGADLAAEFYGPVLPQKRPELRSAGQGVHRVTWAQPQLSSENGVHRKMSIGNDRGIHGVSAPPRLEWFRALQARSRHTRMLCGDWRRVLTPSVLGKGKNVGGRRPASILFDPPYKLDMRARNLYGTDEEGVSDQVREWALEHGDDPDVRIALCGYEGEHDMPDSWEVVEWKGTRGHASESNTNRFKERIWFSPHCLKPSRQLSMI